MKIKRSFWGKNCELMTRFIIETTEAPNSSEEAISMLPKQIYGHNVDFSFTNHLDDWEDAASTNSLTSFDFLDDASPKILGSLGELIENAKKKYQVQGSPSDDEKKDAPVDGSDSGCSSRLGKGGQRVDEMDVRVNSHGAARPHDGWTTVGGRGGSRGGRNNHSRFNSPKITQFLQSPSASSSKSRKKADEHLLNLVNYSANSDDPSSGDSSGEGGDVPSPLGGPVTKVTRKRNHRKGATGKPSGGPGVPSPSCGSS